MQEAVSSSGVLNILSGFDPRNCYGSVLIWNNATVDARATLNISSIPYDSFDVQVFRLDEDHMPGVSFQPLAFPFPPQFSTLSLFPEVSGKSQGLHMQWL